MRSFKKLTEQEILFACFMLYPITFAYIMDDEEDYQEMLNELTEDDQPIFRTIECNNIISNFLVDKVRFNQEDCKIKRTDEKLYVNNGDYDFH